MNVPHAPRLAGRSQARRARPLGSPGFLYGSAFVAYAYDWSLRCPETLAPAERFQRSSRTGSFHVIFQMFR